MFTLIILAVLWICLLVYGFWKLGKQPNSKMAAPLFSYLILSVIVIIITSPNRPGSGKITSPATMAESVQMTPGQVITALQRGEEVPLTELLLHCGGFGQMSFAKEAAHETGLSPQEVAAILQNNDPASTYTLYVHLGAKKGQAEQVPNTTHYQPNSWKCIAP